MTSRDGKEPVFSYLARLLEGYRQMAQDEERETDAQEWCEALIGDAALE